MRQGAPKKGGIFGKKNTTHFGLRAYYLWYTQTVYGLRRKRGGGHFCLLSRQQENFCRADKRAGMRGGGGRDVGHLGPGAPSQICGTRGSQFNSPP